MIRRALALAMVFVLTTGATIATATEATSTPAPAEGSSSSTPTASPSAPATATPSTVVTATPTPIKRGRVRHFLPIRKGFKRSTVVRKFRARNFRVRFKYTYGAKNRVLRWGVVRHWSKAPLRKWSSKHRRFLYSEKTLVIVYLGNGKSRLPWHSGIATWYSIADNTPAGSRATSSGKPLGAYGGFTFASRRFPLGTKLRIKGPNGRVRTVVCTDRGGLETIDLYKPASNWFGMNGKSRFKYQVLRRGW